MWKVKWADRWLQHKTLISDRGHSCCYWLPCLMRLVCYCCGITIRNDRFPSLCCGCQIDYGIQTWDNCVADASWSTKILVYRRYLPNFVSLQTHTQNKRFVCCPSFLKIIVVIKKETSWFHFALCFLRRRPLNSCQCSDRLWGVREVHSSDVCLFLPYYYCTHIIWGTLFEAIF